MSTTTENPNLGGIGSLNGAAEIHKISKSITVTKKNVNGQYYDKNANKVNSIRDAASLVVQESIVSEIGYKGNNKLPDNVEKTITNSTLTFDVGFMNGYELINGKISSQSSSLQIDRNSVSNDFIDGAIEAISTNSKIKTENVKNAEKSTEKLIEAGRDLGK